MVPLAISPEIIFDPATAKLGGVVILTVHMTIMAQFKKFFQVDPRNKFYDLMNYPLGFLLVLPVLPPWPIYSWEAWANYTAGAIGLGALASLNAQKVRDSDTKPSTRAPDNTSATQETAPKLRPPD